MVRRTLGVDIDNVISVTDPAIRKLLRDTLGISLGQEQVVHYAYHRCGITREQEYRVLELFHDVACTELDVMPGVVEALKVLKPRYSVVLVTSRNPVIRDKTSDWLRANGIQHDSLVFESAKPLKRAQRLAIQLNTGALPISLTVLSVERPTPTVTPTPTPPGKDYIGLVDNLRGAGASVDPVGEVTQPFFSGKGFIIKVNGDDVQVFEYADARAAEAEAALVSPDGFSIGTSGTSGISMVGWVAPPHFYREGTLIVLYVGESEAVMEALDGVLGSQFAGQ